MKGLNKPQIIAIFGPAAANKLFTLLDPCCPAFKVRFEVTCTEDIHQPYCVKGYVTSSVPLIDAFFGTFTGDFEGNTVPPVTSAAGVETLIFSQCTFKEVIAPGTQQFSGFIVTDGYPLIPQAFTITFPECSPIKSE